tara:strand:+ start:4114 stop:4479 length:366 start_codon:yes stop_codon:yes gene_type:complete
MGRSQSDKGSTHWKDIFIDAYSKVPIIRVAASAANVSRSTVYKSKEADSDFAKRMEQAEADGAENLESKAYQIANTGNERMLMFLLEHVMPEKYGRKQKVDMTTNLDRFTIKIADDDSDET